MFERFTDRARRSTVLASEEAIMLKHNYIGTEHLLLGLIHEGEGLAGQAMLTAGLTLEGLRERVREHIGVGAKTPAGHLPWTPRAKKVIEMCLRESLRLGHNYIATEHVLLGLIREGNGVGCMAIEGCGVSLKDLRAEVEALIDGTRAPRHAAQSATNYHHLLQVVLDEDGEWVEPFLEWVNGEVDTLDFHGARVPQRLQELLAPLRAVSVTGVTVSEA